MTFDRILVGYDGSAAGETALEAALAVRAPGGTLAAATVCEESWASLVGAAAPRAAAELHAEAEAAHARAAERLAGVPRTEAVLVCGRPADALLALAKHRGATLLVVGRPGHRNVGGSLFGDVVATVVRSAPCSVLVVDYESGKGLPASAGTTWAVTHNGVEA